MTIIYVVSNKPGSGKTALTSSLSVLLNNRGLSSAVYKLTKSETETEVFIQHQLDYSNLLNPENILDSIKLPQKFSSQDLAKSLYESSQDFDVLIVEAPSSQTLDDVVQTATTLKSSILNIVKYSPSLNIETFQEWAASCSGIKLNFLINNATKYSNHSIQTNLLKHSDSVRNQILGVIPESRTLLSISCDDIMNLVDGELIDFNNEPNKNILIKHFMVGGWSLDPGELYFGLLNNKAAIIRGDRPDMQMAALSTNTSCLLLTGGFKTNQYVHLQAEDQGIPIIITNHDTISTMELLNGSGKISRFNHSKKLEKFVSLLEKNVDIESLLALG